MQSLTSTTLLDGLRDSKDAMAWNRFSSRYVPMLLALTKRVGLQDADAQDVVGATLSSFTQSYQDGHYDRTKGRLRDWLKGILRNQISRHFARIASDTRRIEKYGRQVRDEYGTKVLVQTFVDRVSDATEREWQLDLLNEALVVLRRECDVDTYQAFDLYGIKQWTARKVADFMRIPLNSVYQAKSRCLVRLKAIIATMERERD